MGNKMLQTKDGTYTNAVYGFLSIMFKELEDIKPDYMMVTFDMKGPTKRHEMYKDYKGTRKGMPDELAAQMPIIKDVLRAMNITIIEKEGYEAVQLGFEEVSEKKLTKPEQGHLKKAGVAPVKHLKEFRLEDISKYEVGDTLKADVFAEGDKVDVTGISKGKGSATAMRSEVTYAEDLFVGYRGFEKNKTAPLFPFGYGLSYTTFRISDVKLAPAQDPDAAVTIQCQVTNTGQREGKETVQLYVGMAKPPKDRPLKQLKDFAKVSLKPGETKTVTFALTANQLQVWDEQTHRWLLPAGRFRAYVGNSSADISARIDFTPAAREL